MTHPQNSDERESHRNKTPCCGYDHQYERNPIMYNEYNKVVQCHNCGQVFVMPEAAKTQAAPVCDTIMGGSKPDRQVPLARKMAVDSPTTSPDCSQGHSFGRTDGYGGSTCLKCGEYDPPKRDKATVSPDGDVISAIFNELARVCNEATSSSALACLLPSHRLTIANAIVQLLPKQQHNSDWQTVMEALSALKAGSYIKSTYTGEFVKVTLEVSNIAEHIMAICQRNLGKV